MAVLAFGIYAPFGKVVFFPDVARTSEGGAGERGRAPPEAGESAHSRTAETGPVSSPGWAVSLFSAIISKYRLPSLTRLPKPNPRENTPEKGKSGKISYVVIKEVGGV